MDSAIFDPTGLSDESIDAKQQARIAATNGWDEFDKSAADFKPKIVEFIWDGFIPKGRLCYNHGLEGIGKSSIWYNIMAQLTQGLVKGIYEGKPINVAVINPEDGEETGVRPRLELSGADLERVKVYREIRNPDTQQVETLNLRSEHGRAFLEAMIEKHDLKFILVDNQGVTFNIGDTNADSKVVDAFGPYAALAIDRDVTIVVLGHDNKGEHVSARNMMNGSHKYSAVCRAVYHTVEDEEKRQVGLVVYKANEFNKRDVGAMLFEIDGVEFQDTDGKTGSIGVANFIEETEQAGYLWDYDRLKKRVEDAAKAKADAKSHGKGDAGTKPKCLDWVRAWLVANPSGGTKEQVMQASNEWGGFSDKSIENAFATLGASSKSQPKTPGQRGRPKAIRFLDGEALVKAAAYVTENPCPLAPEAMPEFKGLTAALTDEWRGEMAV